MKMKAFALACASITAALVAAACSDDLPSDTTSTSSSSSSSSGSSGTSSSSSGGGTGGTPDCYLMPTNHVEIINACTDAQKIAVDPVLPMLQPDGGLPPLP